VIFPIIIFVFGILVASLLFSKFKSNIGDIVVSGFLIANLVLVLPALIIGLFSNAVNLFFTVLPLLALGCIIPLFVLNFVKMKEIINREAFKRFLMGLRTLPPYSLVLFLLVVCLVVVTVFHPLASEWDAISVYLQNARSVQLSGTLSFDVLRDSAISSLKSPALSISYAWLMDSSMFWVRVWPFLNMVFLAYPIHKLANLFHNGKFRSDYSLALLALLLSPIAVIMMGKYSLYEDIPFVLWFFTSIAFALKHRSQGSRRYLVLSVLSFVLAYFSKDITLFLLPSLVAVLFWSNNKLIRILFSFLSTFPFLLISFNDAVTMGSSAYLQSAIRLGLTTILVTSVFLASTKLPFKPTEERLWSKISVFVLVSMPLWLFFAYMWFSRGIFSPSWGYSLSSAISTVNGISGAVPDTLTSWNFLSGWFTIFRDLLPIVFLSIIGLVMLIRQKKKEFFVPITMLLNLLILFTFLFGTSDTRRAFYFLPLSIALAVFGIDCLFGSVGKNKRQLAVTLILCLSFFYWCYSYGGIGDILFYVSLPVSLRDALIFAGLSALPLVATMFLFIRKKFSKKSFANSLHSKITGVVFLVFLLFVAPFVVMDVFRPTFAGTSANNFSLAYYNSVDSWNKEYSNRGINTIWAGANISEVISYFNNVQDTYATVSFYSFYLSFYSNRSEIDMCSVWGVQTLLADGILTVNNSQNLLFAIQKTNIRYFLLPTADNPFTWTYYQKARELFFVFRAIEEDPMFVPLKIFSGYILYAFENQSQFTADHRNLLSKSMTYNSPNISSIVDGGQLTIHAHNVTAGTFVVAAVSKISGVQSTRTRFLLNYELLDGDSNTTRFVLESWVVEQNGTLTFTTAKAVSFVEMNTVFETSIPLNTTLIELRVVMVPSLSQDLVLAIHKAYVLYG